MQCVVMWCSVMYVYIYIYMPIYVSVNMWNHGGYLKSVHNRELRSYPQVSKHILGKCTYMHIYICIYICIYSCIYVFAGGMAACFSRTKTHCIQWFACSYRKVGGAIRRRLEQYFKNGIIHEVTRCAAVSRRGFHHNESHSMTPILSSCRSTLHIFKKKKKAMCIFG